MNRLAAAMGCARGMLLAILQPLLVGLRREPKWLNAG
jgi:hypothetical protein